MVKRSILLLILLSLFSPTVLKADTTVNYPDYSPIITMTYPNNWIRLKSSGFIRMSSPGQEVFIDIWILKNDSDPSTVRTLGDIIAELNTWCDDVSYARDTASDYDLNGMRMFGYSGSGVLKNAKASAHGTQNFYGHIFNPDSKTKFMIVAIRDQAAAPEIWKPIIKEIIQSIHLVNQ